MQKVRSSHSMIVEACAGQSDVLHLPGLRLAQCIVSDGWAQAVSQYSAHLCVSVARRADRA
jgi:hypothetical protein